MVRGAIQIYTWKNPFLLQESNTLGLAFHRVWVGAELELVHVAPSFHGCIRRSRGSCRFTPEETEEIVNIKTVKDSAENCPLSNTGLKLGCDNYLLSHYSDVCWIKLTLPTV